MTDTDTHPIPLDKILAIQRERIEGHEDFVPATVEAWHLDDQGNEATPSWVVVVTNNGEHHPRDCALTAARVMARTVEPDYLVFSVDTHMTSLLDNPKTGQPWGPGEMQAMCDEEGFCETGQMCDNLAVAIIRRTDQKIAMHSIPYHFHKGTVMYYDTDVISEWDENFPRHLQGRIPDSLRESMSADERSADLREKLAVVAGAVDLETSALRIYLISAGLRLLSEAAHNGGADDMFLSVVCTHTDEEAEALAEIARELGGNVTSVDQATRM